MKVACKFDETTDVIDCPNYIIENIERYQDLFWEWLFDKNTHHSYWIYDNGKKSYCCYRSEAFVAWLNQTVLHNSTEKATILQQNLEIWDSKLPTIHF